MYCRLELILVRILRALIVVYLVSRPFASKRGRSLARSQGPREAVRYDHLGIGGQLHCGNPRPLCPGVVAGRLNPLRTRHVARVRVLYFSILCFVFGVLFVFFFFFLVIVPISCYFPLFLHVTKYIVCQYTSKFLVLRIVFFFKP